MLLGTKNFPPSELGQPARHGQPAVPVPDKYAANMQRVAEAAQELRDEAGFPLVVISGYRSEAYNLVVDGKKSSKHLTAEALDLHPQGGRVGELKSIVARMIRSGRLTTVGGVGFYPWGVHIDVRPRKSGRVVTWDDEARAALYGSPARGPVIVTSLVVAAVLVGLLWQS